MSVASLLSISRIVSSDLLSLLGFPGREWILLDGYMARLAGFEPATPGFVDQCSIQLSYSRSNPVPVSSSNGRREYLLCRAFTARWLPARLCIVLSVRARSLEAIRVLEIGLLGVVV